jgi:hypothetical protein
MPYTGPEDETLPENVQGLDEETRSAWVARWNETYETCVADDGAETDCETRAFAVANALIEGEGEGADEDADEGDAEAASGFCFVALGEGRPVEILRTGEFTDRNGRTVTVSVEDLDAYVANFSAGAAGQDVPFDIDHERAEAAGWLRALWREGERLLGLPDWNAVGEGLVRDRVYRYLSATIDMVGKVIKSVSLVNFPAVKGLAPLELSEGVYTNQPGLVSLSAYLQAMIHQNFTIETDRMAMSGMVDPEQRKALSHAIGQALEAFSGAIGDVGNTMIPAAEWWYSSYEEGENDMGITPKVKNPNTQDAALRTKLRQELEAELAAEKQREAELWESVRKEVEVEMAAKFARRQALTEFATALCSGERALSTPPDQVVAFLEALPENQVETAKTMLQARIVSLKELGSDGKGNLVDKGTLKPLPDEFLTPLRAGTLKLADLQDPIAGLGDLAQYDLSEFKS